MAEDGEYELLPHEELEHLREELHKIKRNPIQGYKEADDLKASIDSLTSAVNNLITLFSNTNDELVDSFKRTTIEEHFSQISSQNEQIAQGILAVAKLVEESRKNPSAMQNMQELSNPINDTSNQQLNSSIPPSMEPPMPAGQSQPLSVQAPSFYDEELPPLNNQEHPFDMPANVKTQELHPLNSQNLEYPSDNSLGGLDLPPPPEKKKGLLGMFK